MSKVRVFLQYNDSVYPITKSTFRVGRNSFCDVVLHEKYVSSTHFCIQVSGDSYIFCDGNMSDKPSTNGSTVDEVFIDNGDCCYLYNGSTIHIRNIKMKFIVEVIECDKSKVTHPS